ncbi:hypothetical protein UlMin_020197 [Ulmus minor]
MIDAAAGGSLMGKTPEDAHELLEIMAENNNQWYSERVTAKRPAAVHKIDSVNALLAQVAALSRKMDSLSSKLESKPTVECDLCGGNHASIECQVGNPFASPNAEQANYVSNFQRPQNNPYSITYNPGWRNHPNLSWGNNQGGFKPSSSSHQPQEKKQSDLEEILGKFIEETRANFRNQEVINRDIQNQLGQLSRQIAERTQGSLPSDTINPKEHEHKRPEKKKEEREEPSTSCCIQLSPSAKYEPPIPYPQRLNKKKLDNQFDKFLEIFKKLHINIPFAEMLEQMPKYAKFMKEILSKKRKLGDHETVIHKIGFRKLLLVNQGLPD